MRAAVEAVGGSPREGQSTMAGAVDQAMDGGRHLLVQAGTGTGKSLAYLVPALRHAMLTGRPVVVSTATVALQTQIVRKDLPRIVEALAPHLPRVPSFGLLKGRGNYVCMHKLEGGYPSEVEPGALFSAVPGDPARDGTSERLGEQVRRLREWAGTTDTGDRDDLEVPVSDRAWRQVSVSGSHCLGSHCPLVDQCFTERNRALAREVDLIVTNHALLAIDAFDNHGIIPDHDVVVFDEAHVLVDRITGAVTETLTAPMVRSVVRDLRGLGMAATALDDAGEAFGTALSNLPDGRVIGRLSAEVLDAVDTLRIEARTAHTDAKDLGGDTAGAAGARKTARANLQEILDVCDRLEDPGQDDVVSVSHSEQTGRSSLQVAPLSVAGPMRGKILDPRTAVLTSATLALGGRFETPAGEIGLAARNRTDPTQISATGSRDAWAGLDVGSPFAYRKQGILYIARQLPPPGREGPSLEMLDHLVELIEASGGGALCLFSSRRGAETAAQHVRARIDLPVGLQGEDTMSRLVSDFRENDAASLFGTITLWQGVDVQGHSCRLVTIDRIPFPRPDDPLVSARQERVTAHGGNGFMAVPAHHAALLMAQGAGRLIRSREDRGMVAVLDPRLATARYGRVLVDAMPPLWPTQDPQVALAALGRLAAATG
jgi:ATP-dependent DNA helicase DinG